MNRDDQLVLYLYSDSMLKRHNTWFFGADGRSQIWYKRRLKLQVTPVI